MLRADADAVEELTATALKQRTNAVAIRAVQRVRSP
jgi:hypothetical protein